jgi:hypothetical protein
MGKTAAYALIIEDDFKNILIIQRKAKRNSPKVWEILQKDIKGKQPVEKQISKMVDKQLKSIAFDLVSFKEYTINEEEKSVIVYTGKLKERITLHKDITMYKWITKDQLDEYDFVQGHKELLLDYFKAN